MSEHTVLSGFGSPGTFGGAGLCGETDVKPKERNQGLWPPANTQLESNHFLPAYPAPPGPSELSGSEGLSGAQLGSLQAKAQGSLFPLQVLGQLPASPKGPRSQVLWVQLCP